MTYIIRAFAKTGARTFAFGAGVLALSIAIGAVSADAQSHKLRVDALASTAERPTANIEPARWVCSPSGFGQTSTCTLRGAHFFGG